LDWIFGTANIATSTLTTNDFSSYHVKTGTVIRRDKITNNIQTPSVFYYTKEKLLNNGIEGKKIIDISLVKEAVHLKSDINTKKVCHSPLYPLYHLIWQIHLPLMELIWQTLRQLESRQHTRF
jgi:hypothetical protein